jgi:GNAT superfamily N-acetyltransferase
VSGAVVYRLATADDIPVLAEMRAAFHFEDDPAGEAPAGFETAFGEVVRRGIESGRWTIWVAEANGSIVSHAFVGLIDKIPRPHPQARTLGYLTNVYTRPEQRNRGIGSALLAQVEDWARANDVELLVVWPSEESVSFYERAGFATGRDPLVWFS